MYDRLHTIPACDGQTDRRTDRQTSCHGIVRAMHTHTTLFAIKGSNDKKTNKTKKKKRNKPLQDKSNTTRQHNSILGLIFSTQSTNDIIGYGELAQKIRFSILLMHTKAAEN